MFIEINLKIPNIYNYIPVDKNGNLLSPLDTGYARGGIDSAYSDDFKFGDESQKVHGEEVHIIHLHL